MDPESHCQPCLPPQPFSNASQAHASAMEIQLVTAPSMVQSPAGAQAMDAITLPLQQNSAAEVAATALTSLMASPGAKQAATQQQQQQQEDASAGGLASAAEQLANHPLQKQSSQAQPVAQQALLQSMPAPNHIVVLQDELPRQSPQAGHKAQPVTQALHPAAGRTDLVRSQAPDAEVRPSPEAALPLPAIRRDTPGGQAAQPAAHTAAQLAADSAAPKTGHTAAQLAAPMTAHMPAQQGCQRRQVQQQARPAGVSKSSRKAAHDRSAGGTRMSLRSRHPAPDAKRRTGSSSRSNRSVSGARAPAYATRYGAPARHTLL